MCVGPATGEGVRGWRAVAVVQDDSKHTAFIVYFISIFIASAPAQISKH